MSKTSRFKLHSKHKWVIVVSILLLLSAIMAITSLQVINIRVAKNPILIKDPAEFLLLGYNIQKYGSFSIDIKESKNLVPTAYREPVFPTILALFIKANPRLDKMDFDKLYGSGVILLRYMQIPFLIILSLLVFYLVHQITKNLIIAFTGFSLTGFSLEIIDLASKLYTEHIAALFLILSSVLLFKAFVERKLAYFLFLGVSLALLVLTKAVFMFFIVIILVFFVVIIIKEKINRKRLAAGLLLLILCYSVIIGSWMYRNYRHFGQFFITNRQGSTLLIRAIYDKGMDGREILASFLYWTPVKSINETLLQKMFKPEEYSGLDRTNDYGYYQVATREIWGVKYNNKYKVIDYEITTTQKDKELLTIAKSMLLNNLGRHILNTPAFFWQGLFAESGLVFPEIKEYKTVNFYFINFLYLASFISIFIISIRKKMWGLFALLLLPAYLSIINALATHDIPRYNVPMIPLLNIFLVVTIKFIADKIKTIFESKEV